MEEKFDKEVMRTVDQEVFTKKVISGKTIKEEDEENGDTDSLEKELGGDSDDYENVEGMFEKPGAFLRAATKKIWEAPDSSKKIEEKK